MCISYFQNKSYRYRYFLIITFHFYFCHNSQPFYIYQDPSAHCSHLTAFMRKWLSFQFRKLSKEEKNANVNVYFKRASLDCLVIFHPTTTTAFTSTALGFLPIRWKRSCCAMKPLFVHDSGFSPADHYFVLRLVSSLFFPT